MKRDITEVIGHTPMLRLDRVLREYGVEGEVFAKLEYLNPGFSKKDRVAKQMILEAEEQGLLRPGQTVVELTSGNTGTGLALVCGAKGYHFVAVMSKGNSMERARMMRALGAEVVLVDQMPNSLPGQVSGEDLSRVEEETRRIVAERHAFRADQFLLEACNHAHEEHTALEMIEQTKGQNRCVRGFCGKWQHLWGYFKGFKSVSPFDSLLCDRTD